MPGYTELWPKAMTVSLLFRTALAWFIIWVCAAMHSCFVSDLFGIALDAGQRGM